MLQLAMFAVEPEGHGLQPRRQGLL